LRLPPIQTAPKIQRTEADSSESSRETIGYFPSEEQRFSSDDFYPWRKLDKGKKEILIIFRGSKRLEEMWSR